MYTGVFGDQHISSYLHATMNAYHDSGPDEGIIEHFKHRACGTSQ
jgi:hypothetical protein